MAITPRSKGLGDIGAIVDRQGRASPTSKAPVKPTSVSKPKIAAPVKPAPRPAPKPVAKVAPKPAPKMAPAPKPNPFAMTPEQRRGQNDTRAPGGGGMDINGNPIGGGMGAQMNIARPGQGNLARNTGPGNGGPQKVGGPAGRPILGGPPAQQAPNPFAQYGEYADRLNQEFNKQKGSYYKSDANDQYFSNPEGFIKNQADQFLNQYKINDYYAKNNPNQNPLNYSGDESPSPDNPGKSGYWNRGIDWDTGLDYGQGGEIYSGGQLYIPQADGTYLNVNSGKIMQQEIPQQDPNNPYGISIGGSQRPTFKEYTPGQAIPKQTSRPNFGNLFGPGVGFENNQPYDMPQTAPDFGNPGFGGPQLIGSQGSSWGYTNPDGSTGMGNNFQPVMNPGMGGPFTPRPDMGPGVGFGVGLPQPGQGGGYYGPSIASGFDPVTGQMTPGTHDFGRFYPGAPPSMSQSLGLDFGNPGMGTGPAFGATDDYGVGVSGFGEPAPYNAGMMSPRRVINQVGKPGFQPRPNMSNAFNPTATSDYDQLEGPGYNTGGFMGGGSGSLFGGGGFAGK